MVWFTSSLFKIDVSGVFTGFVFFSTLASYSVHWYLTDVDAETTAGRTSWLYANKKIHFLFFLVSALGSGLFLLAEIKNFVWILPAVLLTLMYSAPKIPLPFFKRLKPHIWGKTILLAAVWAYITAALPLLISNSAWQNDYWIFCFNRFALIFAICILFDIRDIEHDKTIGVKSIVTLLKTHHVKIIFNIVIIGCLASGIFFGLYFYDVWVAVILIAPAVLTYFLYPKAINTTNDYLFYVILDGLMALTPLLYFMKSLF